MFDKVISFGKIVLIVICFLILLLFAYLISYERKQLKKLYTSQIQIPDKSKGMLHYWQEIRKLFFFPVFYKYTESVCVYNIKALECLKENNVTLKYAEELRSELIKTKEIISTGGKYKPDFKIRRGFISEIDNLIKQWS